MTIEKIGDDCLEIRALHHAGVLRERRVAWSSLRWPEITKICADRYLIELELRQLSVPQQVRVVWTRCHLGGERPWFPGLSSLPMASSQAVSRPRRLLLSPVRG